MMNATIRKVGLGTVLCAVTMGSALVGDVSARAPRRDKNLVVGMKGESTGFLRTLNTDQGPVDAMCFEVDLIDVASGRVIGRGFDCLYNIQQDGSGLTVTDIAIFEFEGGKIISRGHVGVQPTSLPFPGVSHLTGSLPAPGSNSILHASGVYAGATGRVRLSGAVDMSRLSEGVMQFDCLFVIELD